MQTNTKHINKQKYSNICKKHTKIHNAITTNITQKYK